MRLKPLALIAALAAMPVAAEACSCMPYETAEEKIADTEIAFFGVPEDMVPANGAEGQDDRHVTRFTVWRSFTGPDAPSLEITHRLSSAACGMRFQPGQPQLVFAYRGDDGALRTNSCANLAYTRDGTDLRKALEARYPVKWWWGR